MIDIMHDPDPESYQGYIPDGWAGSISAPAGSVLESLFMDMLVSWRTTAYVAAMPGTFAKGIRDSLGAYANTKTPDSSIITFGDNVLKKVSRKVPELVEDRPLRARLMQELANTADDFRALASTVKTEIELETVWDKLQEADPFKMSLWSSQRICYVAFYNAYEAFLVDCTKVLLNTSKLRATDDQFKEALRTGYQDNVSVPCWSHHEVNNARLVRHALSHAGGRVTADLKKQKHGIRVLKDVLQVFPEDNKKLLSVLMKGVDALVATASKDAKLAAAKAV